MKKALLIALAVAAGIVGKASAQEKISITPALVAAAEKEGEVTVQYSNPLDAMQAEVHDFTKAYPKIRVNLERKAGSTGVQSLLQELAAGVNRIDVFQGTDTGGNQALIDQNAFAAVAPANASELDKSARAMAPYLYYPDKNVSVVMYNPKFVSDEQAAKLRSWKGILDPAFKGKISLVEPSFGVTLAPLLYVVNTPGLGEGFLKQLKAQKPVIYLNTAQARDALISGQQPISWGAQWESVTLSYVNQGAPVHFVYTDPTVEWGGNGWGVLAKAPHPNAARLFFAWGMSNAGGLSLQGPKINMRSELTTLADTRSTIKKLSGQPWFRQPKNIWSPDLQDWIKNGPKYQQLWTKVMKQ